MEIKHCKQLVEMRLYHYIFALIIILSLTLLAAACSSPQITPTHQAIEIQIYADGEEYKVQTPAGSTVQNVLDAAKLTLEGKDRVEPTASTILEKGMEIYLIRVEEIFETEQEEIPFRTIQQPNENLPEGNEQCLQTGKNGLKEITYLRVLENGKEVSRDIFSTARIKEPVDQIFLVGVQNSVSPIQLAGRLIYLSDNNAWMMEGSTANRSLIVSTGDLDGRVFELSDDGTWLLFTRQNESEDIINTLWAKKIDSEEELLIDLEVENIIHFADWVPGSNREVAYSTVESRLSSPGWQANNDLQILEFATNGWVHTKNRVLDTNYGGVYGWWGTDFAFSPQGDFLAYIGPDEAGMVDVGTNEKELLLKITPYQTRGDWAWMSGIAVGPNGNIIYTVDHAPPEMVGDAEASPIFDLLAIPLTGGPAIRLVPEVGMFAYPKPSPSQPLISGEAAYQVAYLQANFPNQSDKPSYRVAVIDRDGSNQRIVFPSPEEPGLEPQRDWGAWSPTPTETGSGHVLAVLYQGNIWIVNPATGDYWQVTGDGRVQRLDWR
ncbi:MAG: hypothetical protein DRI56_06510 [Chloroflexota bacterium]|nr:MAG: hypothetical protein DRI56_06510 [Chloroflexota bacterium]